MMDKVKLGAGAKKRRKKMRLALRGGIPMCQICAYDEFPEILQIHHLQNKGERGSIKMRDRYLLVCPNCHAKINKGILPQEIKIPKVIW